MPLKDTKSSSRINREAETVLLMIEIFCHDHHATVNGLCSECDILAAYTRERLSRCPFAPEKPTCAKCPVHCYKPEMRERIRQVMRYSGPRMLSRYPLLAVRHMLDEIFNRPKKSVSRK